MTGTSKKTSPPLLKAFQSMGIKSPKSSAVKKRRRGSSTNAKVDALLKEFNNKADLETEEEEFANLLARIRSKKSPKTTPVKKSSGKKKPQVKKYDIDEMMTMVMNKK